MPDYMQSGVPCRKGPFVEHEKQMIDDAIQRYQKVCRSSKTDIIILGCSLTFLQEHNLDDIQLNDLIHPEYPHGSSSGFWTYVGQLASIELYTIVVHDNTVMRLSPCRAPKGCKIYLLLCPACTQ